MGLNIIKTTAGMDKSFASDYGVFTGGYTLVTTGLNSSYRVNEGTPVSCDHTARTATVCKVAELTADATDAAVEYQVKKNHQFAVGEYLAESEGGAAYAITDIDYTTSEDYDVITVGTTLGVALSAGDGLFKSSATGAAAAAVAVSANGLLLSSSDVVANTGVTIIYAGLINPAKVTKIVDEIWADLKGNDARFTQS